MSKTRPKLKIRGENRIIQEIRKRLRIVKTYVPYLSLDDKKTTEIFTNGYRSGIDEGISIIRKVMKNESKRKRV